MQSPSSGLSRFANAVVFAALLLILLGGMVTSLGGGLSVPDWPTTYGYNMFTFPISQWEGLVFWEHIHRLAGSFVGLLTLALAYWIWRTDNRKWVRRMGLVAAGLVVIQGVLGGLRVTEVSTSLAIVHGCVAQAFLCVLLLLAMALAPRWSERRAELKRSGAARLSSWSYLVLGVVYLQLILGAVMRHMGAGLAIPTFPLTPEGTLMPREHNAFVDMAMMHRIWAAVVAIAAGILITKAIRLVRSAKGPAWYRRLAILMGGLIVIQWGLGAAIIWYFRPPFPTSLHVLNGALLLMAAFMMAVFASGHSMPRNRQMDTSGQL